MLLTACVHYTRVLLITVYMLYIYFIYIFKCKLVNIVFYVYKYLIMYYTRSYLKSLLHI